MMEIEGKEVPHIEIGGPEWTVAMLELDKETLVKMLGRKYLDEAQEDREGVLDQGLQIQRYNGIEKDEGGVYCMFSDAEKFHSMLQEALGKNMILSAEIINLKKQVDMQVETSTALREGMEKAVKQRDSVRDALKGLMYQIMRDGTLCCCPAGKDEWEPVGKMPTLHATSCEEARAALRYKP